MRPVCFHNIPPYTRARLLSLFSECGAVQCFSIKQRRTQYSGQDAINHFHKKNFESGIMIAGWATNECFRRHDSSPSKISPSKTLYVFNFDIINTKKTDLETYFNKYGEIVHVRILEDYAFVKFARQKDATRALEGAHMSQFGAKLLKVDYSHSVAFGSRPRGSLSPNYERYHGHSRSRSPVTRGSQNYDRYHGRSRSRSPVTRGSRNYDRYHGHSRSRSPVTRGSRNYNRYHGRSRPCSPVTRGSPVYDRYEGPSSNSRPEGYGRRRNPLD